MIERHMNAVKVKEKQLEKLNLDDWIVEEKFKGIRVWYIKEFGHYRLVTRGGEDVTSNFPHITEFDWFPELTTFQLDCELFDPNQQDEVVSGWAMTINIDPEKTVNCILHCFDILDLNNVTMEDKPQLWRKEALNFIPFKGPIKKVEYFPAHNHREFYEHILSKGGEGIMLKNKFADYRGGSRKVSHWFKRKKRDNYDVVIMGFTKGKGKFEGQIGAIKVGQFVAGELRYICNVSGFTDELRKDITNNSSYYLGHVITVRAMEQDQNSLALIEPSFQSLRIDKRPEECIYESPL